MASSMGDSSPNPQETAVNRTVAASFAAMAWSARATLTEGTTQSLMVLTPGVGDAVCVVHKGDGAAMPVGPSGVIVVQKSRSDLSVECSKEGYASGKTTVQSFVSDRARIEMPVGFLVD